MALVFGNDEHIRGCYRQVNLDSSHGLGAYLFLPAVNANLPMPQDLGASPDPYMITNISFAQREKYHLVQCFDDKVYTYAFGHDPTSSLIDISYVAFMIKADGSGMSTAPRGFISSYKRSRLYENQAYATVTLGTATLKGFVVSMDSATADAQHNLQTFTIHMLGVEVQNA